MVALDRETTSVVVSIRGTMSFADLATDAMALPESIWEWLPDSLRKVSVHSALLNCHDLRSHKLCRSCQRCLFPARIHLGAAARLFEKGVTTLLR